MLETYHSVLSGDIQSPLTLWLSLVNLLWKACNLLFIPFLTEGRLMCLLLLLFFATLFPILISSGPVVSVSLVISSYCAVMSDWGRPGRHSGEEINYYQSTGMPLYYANSFCQWRLCGWFPTTLISRRENIKSRSWYLILVFLKSTEMIPCGGKALKLYFGNASSFS